MKKKQIWIIVGIIVAGVLVWWLFFASNKATAPDGSDNGETSEVLPQDDPNQPLPEGSATNQLPNGDGLAVLAQQAGSFVTVDNYKLSKPGFVVIHVANVEDAPGAIIGKSGLLQAGSGQDLEITAKIETGKTYIAMLHYDNGDKKFDATTDLAATSKDQAIMVTFQAQ